MKLGITLFAASLFGVASVAAAPASVRIDPDQSTVAVVVKATVDSFTAAIKEYRLDLVADFTAQTVLSAEFSFEFKTLKTGRDERDHQMYAWQKTEAFPVARFHLQKLSPSNRGKGQMDAAGAVTFHGVTKEVTFPVSIVFRSGKLVCDGEAIINTGDFALPTIRKFAVLKVDPRVTLKFHLQGEATP